MRLEPNSGAAHGRWTPSRAVLLLVVAGLVAAQQMFHLRGDDLVGYALNDAMHVPLFVALTLLIGWLLGGRPLILVVALAGLLAAGTEAAQTLTGRNASLLDLGLDGAGITVGALGCWVARRLARRGSRTGAWLLLVSGIALATVAVAAVRPVNILVAKALQADAFPVLLMPEAGLEGPLLATRSRWRVVPAPQRWSTMAGRPVLDIVWAAERYPGIVLLEVAPDWSGFAALVADVLVPGDEVMTFTARVHYHGGPRGASWLWRRLPPGPHRVRFPLDELLVPGHGPIDRLVLHVGHEDAGRRMLLGTVRLDPADAGPPGRAGPAG